MVLTTIPLEHETVDPEHSEPEPTPTTEMGEQLRPRRTVRSCSVTPSNPRRNEPVAELAYMNQHH